MCRTGTEFEFDAVTSITDELDEGYINSDETIYDAEVHSDVITKAKGISELKMQSNKNGLEYSLDGSDWKNLGTTKRTITSDFSIFNCVLKQVYNQVITTKKLHLLPSQKMMLLLRLLKL